MKKISVLLLCLMFAHALYAAELFGTVEAVSGEVSLTGASGERIAVTIGQKIYAGQSIQTAAGGEVHIATVDSGLIALRPNSRFRIDRYQAKGDTSDETVFTLFTGAVRSITGWIARRNASAYRLNTNTVTIGVRGTDHETTVLESATSDAMPGTYDTVKEGVTVLKTALGELEVRPGQHAFASRDGMPRLLAQHPEFYIRRQLRIEERIRQRKEALQQGVQSAMKERAGQMRENMGEHQSDRQKSRESIKRKIQEHRPPERPRQ